MLSLSVLRFPWTHDDAGMILSRTINPAGTCPSDAFSYGEMSYKVTALSSTDMPLAASRQQPTIRFSLLTEAGRSPPRR